MIAILAAYILVLVIKYSLDFLNIRHLKAHGETIPSEFLGIIDYELLKRTREYTLETSKFLLVSSLFSNALVIIFLFGGLLDWYNSMILSLHLPFIAAGWLFSLLLILVNEIISIPFGAYHTFKIENKYGFNTTTAGLWLSDLLKSLAISTLFLSIVVVAGLALVKLSPGHWWFWVWLFLLLFSLFVVYVSPYLIDPLFNRFTPLADEGLSQGIHRLTEKAGITVQKVLKMDQSKRSRHSNAYFAGIGKTRRIVLFDTLLEKMDHSEIMAVLAHEIGHWKKHHVFKGLVITQCISLAAFYAGSYLIDSGVLMNLFRISHPTFYVNFLIAAFLASLGFFLVTPLLNLLLRHFERESDRYACSLYGNSDALVTAMIKLTRENLSNLFPHPLYAAVYYSHPPVLMRTKEIRGYCEKTHTE